MAALLNSDRTRREMLAILLGGAGAAATGGVAWASYPERVVTGVVPFGPGGGPDIFARLTAQHLTQRLGQPFVIQNRPGGSGSVGVQSVLSAKPDGHTLLFNGIAMVMTPAVFRKLPYDPVADIQPIGGFAESAFAVAVSTDRIKATNVREFIDLIKKDPNKYNAASGGAAGTIGAALFMQQNDFKIEFVNYKGTGEATTALIRGEADFQVTDPSAMAAGISSGKIRLLAIAGRDRLPLYPDIPTTAEAGIPDFQVVNVYGVYAHSQTPRDIIDKLNAELAAIVDHPDVLERFRSLNWVPRKMKPEEMTTFYRAELAKWKDVVIKANIPMVD